MSDPWPAGFTSLRRWRLGNFKSVADSAIDLAPLTVLVGANSSGKSSLLQSVLAVVQAIESPGEAFPLNGPLVRLGSYDETVSAFAPKPEAPIAIGGQFVLPFDEAHYLYESIAPGVPRGIPDPADLYPLRGYGIGITRLFRQPRLAEAEITFDWTAEFCGAPSDEPGSTLLQRCNVQITSDGRTVEEIAAERVPQEVETGQPPEWTPDVRGQTEYSVGYRGSMQSSTSSTAEHLEIAALAIRGGVPVGALIQMQEVEHRARQWLNFAAAAASTPPGRARGRHHQQTLGGGETTGDPQATLEQLAQVIATDVAQLIADRKADRLSTMSSISREIRMRIRRYRPHELLMDLNLLIRHREELVAAVKQQLGASETLLVEPERSSMLRALALDLLAFMGRRVLYLGPLREDPQVAHKARPGAREGFIGVKGEYSAAVLHAARRELVDAPIPGSDRVESRPLGEAVNDWAAYLGIGASLTTTDRGRLGLDLRVRDLDIASELDLTSVGAGVSQLLPVLVMCLLAPRGSLLLIEQPELHLHPAMQHKLADFLLAVTRAGRQLIVETHSEYLVARLRRRLAEDPRDTTRALLAFVFAERQQGQTTYRSVRPTAYGGFEDWPAGFLDQTAVESRELLRAGVTKRRLWQGRERRPPESGPEAGAER